LRYGKAFFKKPDNFDKKRRAEKACKALRKREIQKPFLVLFASAVLKNGLIFLLISAYVLGN